MKDSLLRRIVRALVVDTAFAVVSSLMVSSVGHQAFRLVFAINFVYANFIGGLAHLLLPLSWCRTEKLKKPFSWIARGGLLVLAALAGSLGAGVVSVAMGWFPATEYWATFRASLEFTVIVTVVFGSGISLYESLRARLAETTLALRTRELEKERALKLATEARLAALESRIHPHFLFNTLNSISALIPEDPQKAEALVGRMAALLRFSLDSRQTGLVEFGREMTIVRDYLEIEKARFGERLRYRIEIMPDLEAMRVLPLSVQTLVENSVKYAVAPTRAGGEIVIAARENAGVLSIEVADSGPGFDAGSVPSGHGIENLRSRLAALFGSEGGLSNGRRDSLCFVRLTVPQLKSA